MAEELRGNGLWFSKCNFIYDKININNKMEELKLLFEVIDEKEFSDKVNIKFDNILEGFDSYYNGNLQGNLDISKKVVEEKFLSFFERLLKINGEENSFIDFYYQKLSEEDKSRLKELLSENDEKVLKLAEEELKGEGIYFRLSKEILPFILRLSTREVLFSTFYFTKIPCTIWGNYNMKFPCFFNNYENMKLYKDISKDMDLKIE